jgi:acetyl-CoA C-acetyltransferase
MDKVFIAGVGMHPFGRFGDKSYVDMGREAVQMALKDANIEWKDIQAAFCSRALLPLTAGVRTVLPLGRTSIPIIEVEAACAGGGACLRQAALAVAQGQCDVVLAFGIEKASRGFFPAEAISEGWQARIGLSQSPCYWALLARRHMHDYGTTIEQIAQVSVKNHKNGVHNPNALFRKAMTMEEILNSPVIADPMRLFMICSPDEGAAAAVICSEKVANKKATRPLRLMACSHRIALYPWVNIPGYSWDVNANPEPATTLAAKDAYEQAGIGPEDIDVAEVQDTDAFMEIEACEDLGFCKKGEGGKLVESGATEINGKIPVNPSGGLICKGEPIGASGLGQVFEIVAQIRGEAGNRQVPGPRIGLTHVFGLFGHCSVNIIGK